LDDPHPASFVKRYFPLLLIVCATLALFLVWRSEHSPIPVAQEVQPEPAHTSPASTVQDPSLTKSSTADSPASPADCCGGAAVSATNSEGAVGLAVPLKISKPQSLQALADFQAWAERYAAAPPASKSRMLPEGQRLADSRRAIMAGLIRFDPRAALSAQLPYRLRM